VEWGELGCKWGEMGWNAKGGGVEEIAKITEIAKFGN
jgi:hypothetical protein